MYTDDLLTLIAAALTGSLIGNLLFISLIYKIIIQNFLDNDHRFYFYLRLYRLNIVLALMAATLSALINNQEAALLLVILAASYVFARMHLLKNIYNLQIQGAQTRQIRGLRSLQNLVHLLQISGAVYVIILLL